MNRTLSTRIFQAGILAAVVSAAIAMGPLAARAADGNRPPEATEGFVPLFDGRSFDGWKFEPQFAGHWVARDGVISCDGRVKDNPFGQWNRFVITILGDRVSVVLNGRKVIDNALLPQVPRSGAIALQNHTDPVEFRNLYIKEMK